MTDGPKGYRTRGGNLLSKEQFEVIFTEHRSSVLGYSLRRVPPEDAKDVVSETFLVAWRRREELPTHPQAWLLGVARKVIATRRRSDQRRISLRERVAREPVGRGFDSFGDRLGLAEALSALSEIDQEILLLVAWDGLAVKEAAQVLDMTPARFSVRLHRARNRLRKYLAHDPQRSFLTTSQEESA